ncbi:MAG: signal peptide peptidase SppA [Spirochaetota bacterium]
MKYTVIELSGTYRETGVMVSGLTAANTGKQFRMDRLVEKVDTLLGGSSVQTVILHRKEDFSCPSLAGIEAIRRLVMRLRGDDRTVLYYSIGYTLDDLYLASACNRRIAHPQGTVSFLGRSVSHLYFAKFLNRQSIEVDVIRHGRYKSAMNRFIRDSVDRFDREQIERLLHVMVARVRTLTSSDMLISDATIDALLEGQVLTTAECVERGWIERLDDFEGVEEEFRQKKRTRAARDKKLRGKTGHSGPRVSVMFFEGAIDHGENRRSPLFGQIIGSDWYVRRLRAIRKDKKTQAVVLRVNSPGGSATASEDIRRELDRLKEKKPVIVSMGSVAASGGYWISMAAHRIFAQKFTITGSIGVIAALINLNDFLKKNGITSSVIKQGDHADLGSALRKMSVEERRIFEQTTSRIYGDFVRLVADSRGLSEQDVIDMAEGRIWSGEDAVQNGLIDEIGDLRDAVDYAATRLGVSSVQVRFGPTVKRPFVARLLQGHSGKTEEAAPFPDTGVLLGIGETLRTGLSPSLSALYGLKGLQQDLYTLNAKPMALYPGPLLHPE